MKFAEIIVDISSSEVDRIFDYAVPNDLEITAGMRVLVPFGKREIEGFVIALKDKTDCLLEKIKPIAKNLDAVPVITNESLALSRFMVKKYHLRMADTLRLFIPSQMRGGRIKELTRLFVKVSPEYQSRDSAEFIKKNSAAQKEVFDFLCLEGEQPLSKLNEDFSASAIRNLITRGILISFEKVVGRRPYQDLRGKSKDVDLTAEQQFAVDKIQNSAEKHFLLHGVTGSGKTEVYMACIEDALRQNKTAIMLVPEIALTPQMFKNFRLRFGDSVAILHSGLSAGERFDDWRRLLTGEASVALGARSAIFAPLENLGIVIIDEEHEQSYISETNPRYHAIEVAEFRAKHNNAKLVLGSATPSIESYHRTRTGEIVLLEMTERVNKKPLPEIGIVNMCEEFYVGNNGIFSRKLKAELIDCIEKGNQAMLFINRRGYSSYVICHSCGFVAKCTECDVSLVYHKEENVLKCHYCAARFASLDICPECKGTHIRRGFVGTQQVVEILESMFPNEKILRMDNDTTQSKDSHAKILEEFGAQKASILVGTQMIAKGHDFPSVTLVGIIDADMSLHFSDYRSIERTFQLITQVSGRAGRDNKTGKVILQTLTPRHYVYKYAVKNDYHSFFEKECNLRMTAKYPPFSKMIRILVSGENEDLVGESLKFIFEKVCELSKGEYNKNFAYLAAMRSPVKRIQNKYRMQILMRLCGKEDEISDKVFEIIEKHKHPKVLCFIEKNPSNLS
ncbi:MAG: primosomal protein N' [Firmicutes bacterium]|nr:primosomal protein N' [Bacillota bacterium]